jgi:hypothetical protein
MDYHGRMTQSIGDVMANRNYGEPPEVRRIKDFVKAEIGIVPGVSSNRETYIIRVPSAAAAGTLRPGLFRLHKLLDTKKRILIRISQA